ncbi:bifunctional DNA primase/polymerase [Demequina iriomotensis]|uniref:bifunctional DNA primase/polymerase n=1 Tax=Demequina iriomotensis TaxID=1536641 RepID=UPI00078524C2|nr:bifunctional DNA primase/polymerase [Demequina iriomotensis]
MDVAHLLATALGRRADDAALRFADAGIPVFPCAPGEKRPLTRHGFHDATTNASHVARWWRDWPQANIGLPTGSISGIEAVDVDMHGPVHGFDSFERARREGLVDGWTALVRTPSGGIHACFPADPHRRQASWQAASAGVDFRGEGGYILVPPSRVRVGARRVAYELIGAGHDEPTPVDAAALRRFLDPRPAAAAASARPARVPLTIAADAPPGLDVERLASWVARRGEGERNRGLFWAACRFAEHGITFNEAQDRLGPAAERAGLPTAEIAATVRSAYRAAAGASPAAQPEPPPPGSRLSTEQVLS